MKFKNGATSAGPGVLKRPVKRAIGSSNQGSAGVASCQITENEGPQPLFDPFSVSKRLNAKHSTGKREPASIVKEGHRGLSYEPLLQEREPAIADPERRVCRRG